MGNLKINRSYPPAISLGSTDVDKVMQNTTRVWPATNYYDCGYGCQYYASPPACTECYPTTTNILHSLYINSTATSLDYYVTLSNNLSATAINYKVRIQNVTRATGWIVSGTHTVDGYTIDIYFNATLAMGVTNVLGDTFDVELSDDNGVTWTSPIVVTTPKLLNYYNTIPIVATGGSITTTTINSQDYKIHTFTTSGTFAVTDIGNGVVDVLVVAGGGAGRDTTIVTSTGGGGGGGGGLLYVDEQPITTQSYTITVGDGGVSNAILTADASGENSSALGLTAIGGGAGSSRTLVGSTGGSGGGGAYDYLTGYSGTGGQGYDGGNSIVSSLYGGGGGGGASGVGGNGSTTAGGSGGAGVNNSINGISTGYSGGGGGAIGNGASTNSGGGTHGGGDGGSNTINAVAGSTNTGGGGGGSASSAGGSGDGANGGSGVVIIRYRI